MGNNIELVFSSTGQEGQRKVGDEGLVSGVCVEVLVAGGGAHLFFKKNVAHKKLDSGRKCSC